MVGLRSMICNANDFSNDEKAGFPTLSRRWAVSPRMGDIPARPGDFCNVKGQREIQFTLAFVASHEARRRMAVYAMQPAGNHTSPASRGTCRATAVKPRPTGMSHEQPRALWRGIGCRASPARPASREARCRAAVKPRPTGMSHEHPARLRRAEMGAGL